MDILTIGEVLIDLTQTGKDARSIPQFAANPGGAPANLAVAASRLGAQTAFIGKVGADAFGRYLKEVLAENKVDVSGMAVDADHPTTMAVVSVDATGERDFSFYRSANADVMLCKEDISDEALKAAKIVHFGSVSLTADPSRTATLDAAARAKKLGATITYDPNYRANLWKNKEDAIAQMKAPLPLVDILKVSDEELPLLTGTTDCESGTAQLAQNGIRLIFVTLGANGVFYRFGDKTGHVAGVPCKVGDTNGAGDTFFGAALSKLCKEELDTLTVDKLEGFCHGFGHFCFCLNHVSTGFFGFSFHFLLQGNSHSTTFLSLCLSDVLVSVSLVYLQGSSDVPTYIDVGNINGKDFESSTCIQSFTQHELGDGVGILEYRFVVFGRTDGGNDTFAYTSQYGVFTGTTH